MSKTVLQEGDEGVRLIVREGKRKKAEKKTEVPRRRREPVHVVYGGAHLFKAGTPAKLGAIALNAIDSYAPTFAEFAASFELAGSGFVTASHKDSGTLEKFFRTAPDNLKTEDFPAWFALTVYDRTIQKLRNEPVEDFRIDFEDGYGFRPDADEDRDAAAAALELASAMKDRSITPFAGFRIKPYTDAGRQRAKRTLNIFLDTFLDAAEGTIPENFVVTLPKVTDRKEVAELGRDLKKIEKHAGLEHGSILLEIMVEHPLALIDKKGAPALKNIIKSADGRCIGAHFGAYDYTASLGIAASYQDLSHPACDLARQMMLLELSPLDIRLSDSVTTHLPVPVHKASDLTAQQAAENQDAVRAGWRTHYTNVRRSMAAGFYQSWDLHPNQLVARYAAVYSFFLEACDAQAARLRSFLENGTRATLTGNAFDDAATAMGFVNFFRRALECGALSEEEILSSTGLSHDELRSGSFGELMAARASSEAEGVSA
jgi:citrate lyase beta subunit